MNPLHKVVIIEGCRTPFLRSGTDYMDLLSYQLGGFAIKGLLKKTGIDPQLIDGVVLGNVIANVKTPNVAREAALWLEYPKKYLAGPFLKPVFLPIERLQTPVKKS